MPYALSKNMRLKDSIPELGHLALTSGEVMMKRVFEPIINGQDLWDCDISSRTLMLYSGKDSQGICRFKIDHDYDFFDLVYARTRSFQPIAHREREQGCEGRFYQQSRGTEFVFIERKDNPQLTADHVIRSDKYKSNIDQICKGKLNDLILSRIGAFQINTDLTYAEALKNEFWAELAVGKSDTTPEEYLLARNLVEDYAKKCVKRTANFKNRLMGIHIGYEREKPFLSIKSLIFKPANNRARIVEEWHNFWSVARLIVDTSNIHPKGRERRWIT